MKTKDYQFGRKGLRNPVADRADCAAARRYQGSVVGGSFAVPERRLRKESSTEEAE
jgi:hypothetical protein